MSKKNKKRIVSNSLLFFLLRDSLPLREKYSYDEFNQDKEALVDSLLNWLEEYRDNIDGFIEEKEKQDQAHFENFTLLSLTGEFKEVIRKTYPHLTRSSIKKKLRDQILSRDGYKCQYCGANLKELEEIGFPAHVDHIKPKRAGGKDTPGNLVAACWQCNLGKKDYDLFEYEDE